MSIYLDFFSGSHGHFLEYVINTWLFKGPRVSAIFTDLGASHLIRKDPGYMSNRFVIANHYTEFKKLDNKPDSVIRIGIDSEWANYIYQINVMCRAGDIPIEKKITNTPAHVRDNPVLLRNEWYSKFNSLEDGYAAPTTWEWQDVPSFNFPMESLFDIVEFYQSLHKLANFLQTTFVPDAELAKLLEQFLDKNQGWQYYKKSKELVAAALSAKSVSFDSNEILQALVNSLLSKSVGLFDGAMFDNKVYPNNTVDIWNHVLHHLETFDAKF